jgi:SAM-dependent methyltransferase
MFGSDTRQFKVADIRGSIDLVDMFDVVICFEMIEHIHEQEFLVESVRRFLKPDGVFISSSPEIEVYNSLSFERNEHHVKELTRDQYADLLAQTFPYNRIFGQFFVQSSFIAEQPEKAREWLEQTSPLIQSRSVNALPTYLIGVSSKEPITEIKDKSLMKSSLWRNLGGELVAIVKHARNLEIELANLRAKKPSHLDKILRKMYLR